LFQNLEIQFDNFNKNWHNYIKITSLEFIIKFIESFYQYVICFISIVARFTMFEHDKIYWFDNNFNYKLRNRYVTLIDYQSLNKLINLLRNVNLKIQQLKKYRSKTKNWTFIYIKVINSNKHNVCNNITKSNYSENFKSRNNIFNTRDSNRKFN